MAPPCAACSPSASTAIVLRAEDVELAFGERLLVELAAFGRGRDGVEDAGVGDAGFGVVGNELVAVGGDANAGVTRPGSSSHDLPVIDRRIVADDRAKS